MLAERVFRFNTILRSFKFKSSFTAGPQPADVLYLFILMIDQKNELNQ
jgi:hypothetical protein